MKYVFLASLCLSCGREQTDPKVTETQSQRLVEYQKTISEVCKDQEYPQTIKLDGKEYPCGHPEE